MSADGAVRPVTLDELLPVLGASVARARAARASRDDTVQYDVSDDGGKSWRTVALMGESAALKQIAEVAAGGDRLVKRLPYGWAVQSRVDANQWLWHFLGGRAL